MDTSRNSGRRTTLKDIAKRLDVSHATVSRALNRPEDPMISDATRLRVRELASEMGYRPNHAARSLATGRTGLIALWLWTEGDLSAYHAVVSQTMHSEAHKRAYQLLVKPVTWSTLKPQEDHHFDAWNVDGILAHEAGPAIQAQYLAGGPRIPVVSTGAFHFLPGVDHVTIDLTDGISAAMRHLLEVGRKRIVYVTETLKDRAADPRFLIYNRSLEEAGHQPAYLEVPGHRAGVRQTVREYYASNPLPDALFCHNDNIAIAAYRGLCDLGVRVPDDVAIVGCDGIEDSEYLEVPLTTIVQPLAEMCSLALRLLEARIQNPSHPLQEVTLYAGLVIRSSTGGSAL